MGGEEGREGRESKWEGGEIERDRERERERERDLPCWGNPS